MNKTKKLSDTAAVKLCKKFIDKAIKKGVVLRSGWSYLAQGTVGNEEKLRPMACALGGIEHGLAVGKKEEANWSGHSELAKKLDHGITVSQLMALETGFEYGSQARPDRFRRHRLLVKLGQRIRREADARFAKL
jgi:hypothetical protein